MARLFFDFETRSPADIAVGYDNYFPVAEPTLLTWALDDGPVNVWELGMRRPERFINLCYNPGIKLVAHNAPFERHCLKYFYAVEVALERWHCTMAQAYAHSLPGSLEVLGTALGLPLKKQKIADGKKLVLLFCKPDQKGKYPDRHSHPDEWRRYVEYGIGDTEALREVFKRMPAHNYSGKHHDMWCLDQRINSRGFAIDVALAKAAVKVTEKTKKRLDAEVNALTDGDITAATQRDRVLTRLVGEDGLLLTDLSAGTLRKELENDALDSASRRLIELRLETALTSTSKYKRMMKMAGADGRVRWTMQFAGADRTGRWAGRGIQPQNFVRPSIDNPEYIEEIIVPAIKSGDVLKDYAPEVYGHPNRACADALRATIWAPPGKKLVVADWSNIEGRVLAWLAGEEWKLQAFREADAGTGPDVYKLGYSRMFRVDVGSITKFQRTLGKVIDLAGGFAGSVGAFASMAAIYEVDLDALVETVPVTSAVRDKAQRAYEWALTQERDYGLQPETWQTCHALVQAYRAAHPETEQFWNELWSAMIHATESPDTVISVREKLLVWRSGDFLIVQLPSGRRLLYARPRVKRDEENRPSLSYVTARNKQWRRTPSWRGLPVENVVQAIANDFLREALPRIDPVMPVVLHVHDEIVTEVEENEPGVERLVELMNVRPEWASDIPLASEGYESRRFRKT